jgi:hypothetical protein
MTAQISGRLSNDLHSHIMPATSLIFKVGLQERSLPGHPRNLRSVVHVLVGFVKSVKIRQPRIAVVLPCTKQSTSTSSVRAKSPAWPYFGGLTTWINVVYNDVLRGIPPKRDELFTFSKENFTVPSEAEIEASHECNRLINYTHFLMLNERTSDYESQVYIIAPYMSPIKGAGLEVRRGTLDHDIGMQRCQSLLRIAANFSVLVKPPD